MQKINIFDILKSISDTKQDISDHLNFEKEYNSFMINRYLSMLPETVFYAMFIDTYPNIPKKQQYLFYLNEIPKAKRWFKYHKKDKKVDRNKLKLIMKYFQIREDLAENMMEFLDKKDFSAIKKLYK